MTKQKEGMFSGRARRSMEKPAISYGYLNVPDDVDVFKPEGDTEVVFDIIPYIVSDPNHMDNKKYDSDAVVGEPWWKRPLKIHRNVGSDTQSIICPTTIGKKCPICEYFTKKRREGEDWDDIRDYMPSKRSLYVIIPVDVDDCEVDYEVDKIHIMEQPDFYFAKALDAALDKDITAENFADPEMGLSLRVYFRKNKIGFGKIEFAEAVKVDFEDRGDNQYTDNIVDESPDLDAMMKILPYKEIDALFYGMENLDDVDYDEKPLEEDEATPRKERTRKTARSIQERTFTRKRTKATKTEEEDEPEREKESPRLSRSTTNNTSTRSRKPKERSKPPKNPEEDTDFECSYGHIFGEDTDEYDDCDKCNIWEACKDEKEGSS
jgi:hypothetical protein